MKNIKSKHGHEVSVSHVIELTATGVHAIRITATCGSTTHTPSATTIGADDGPRRVLLPEERQKELQEIIEAARQAAADEASFRESIAEQIGSLK
jgi:hypothetical protein